MVMNNHGSNLFDFGGCDGAGEVLGVVLVGGEEGSIAVVVFGETVDVAVGTVAAGTAYAK
jgi:hypothetical protein